MKIPSFFTKGSAQRRTIVLVITLSVAIHVVAGIVAGVWIVARYFSTPPATFVAKKSVMLPPKLVDPRMQSSEFEGAAPKPAFDDKMASIRETSFALPDLPNLQLDMPMDPSAIVTDASSMGTGGQGAGGGSGSGEGGGGGGGFSGVSFFGIKDTAKRVIIVVDTSNSMFTRTHHSQQYFFDFKTIKEETIKLIQGLSINTLFNVVIYEGGSMAWRAEMAAASDSNKQEATKWIEDLDENPESSISGRAGKGPKLMEGGGTRLDTALKQVFSFGPDVVFLITDGEINRGNFDRIPESEMLELIEGFQKALPEEARIHVIHYLTTVVKPEEQATLKAIAKKNKGRFQEVAAKETKSGQDPKDPKAPKNQRDQRPQR